MEQSQNPETKLSKYENDIIGEVCNISMGAAATAFSSIIGEKVMITSPEIMPATQESIQQVHKIPAVGVAIQYTKGIGGSNLLIIKKEDVLKVVSRMMGKPVAEEEFGEIHMSAIAEVMNQMMGSAATALSGFIGTEVSISPPEVFLLTEENKHESFDYLYTKINNQVLVQFQFTVEHVFESQLINIMSHEFSETLIRTMMQKYGASSESAAGGEPAGTPAAGTSTAVSSGASPSASPAGMPASPAAADTYREAAASVGNMAAGAGVSSVQQEVKQVHPVILPDFGTPSPGVAGPSNFGLIEDVPLEISVEVGRAKRQVRDIIDLASGSVIELDKQAGDPVDVLVNGKLIAHGEVVVIDESFGVRITDIASKGEQK